MNQIQSKLKRYAFKTSMFESFSKRSPKLNSIAKLLLGGFTCGKTLRLFACGGLSVPATLILGSWPGVAPPDPALSPHSSLKNSAEQISTLCQWANHLPHSLSLTF